MNKIIGMTELQRHFKQIFDDVTKHQSVYTLTRRSRPEAVLLPYEQYLRLVRPNNTDVTLRFKQMLSRMQSINARFSDEEIESDLTQATKTLRKAKQSLAHCR
jgi:prevent-host-death family protein